jgi:hypothetical protein
MLYSLDEYKIALAIRTHSLSGDHITHCKNASHVLATLVVPKFIEILAHVFYVNFLI